MGELLASAAKLFSIASMAAGFWHKAVNVSQIIPLLPGGSALDPIRSSLTCPATTIETLQATEGRRQMAGNTYANQSLEYAKQKNSKQTQFSIGCYTNTMSLINSLTDCPRDSFLKYLQNTFTPKP